MGGVCGMLGRREKNVQGFCRKTRRKETTRKTGVDGRMGSKRILGRLALGVEWIHFAQEWGRSRAVVNAVMNLRVLATRS
jgi:hypothetical protein